MPSRPHSPAPLGALQPPKPATHAAASAPDHHRHAARLPGEVAASLRTISAKIYIYIYTRQEQQMGQEVCGTAPSNTTHKHQVREGGGRTNTVAETRKVPSRSWWRPQPPVPPSKATRHQPCPTERRVSAPDPQEPTTPGGPLVTAVSVLKMDFWHCFRPVPD